MSGYSYLNRHPGMRDALNFFGFVILVFVGMVTINSFIFRSFNVVGQSMEPTFYTGDRLIVNRLPVTMAQLQNDSYVPTRGEIIVFKNPRFVAASGEEYLVKRVVAFGKERVVVRDGTMRVYNSEKPDGFDPNNSVVQGEPSTPVSGEVDTVVADGTVFVVGDHRDGQHSRDSRNGLGTVPYYDIVGPVGMQIWPLNRAELF
ncbi:signal peptidase I [Candidatus Saccharibacteria bacterium]|nr:MAG: signal peptidase I [Candidatus Saccharibacteria bacterium]